VDIHPTNTIIMPTLILMFKKNTLFRL